MSATTTLPNQRFNSLLIPFISALLIVLFLAFIDEGYYDFRWMSDPGSWAAFGIYMAIFFAIQSLIYNFVLKSLKGSLKNIIMLGGITPAVVMLILGLLV